MNHFVHTAFDVGWSISVALIISLGLYLVYGLQRVINMAHGEMVMLGAYVASVVHDAGFGFIVAAVSATATLGALGIVVERLLIRRLYGRDDLSTLLATWGLGLCIVEAVRLTFGPSGRFLDPPIRRMVVVAGVDYPAYSLILIASTGLLFLAVYLLLHRSAIGLKMRATMENPARAEFDGVDTRRIYRWTFASGCAMAGFSGCLLAPTSSVTPQMGSEYAYIAFMVVIVGGTRSVFAPLVGAILVGGLRSILNVSFGFTPATLGMLCSVILVLFVRPAGVLNGRTES